MPVIIIDEGPGSAASPPYNNGQQVQQFVDLDHFRTPPGWAKIGQFVFGIVVLAIGPPFWLAIVGCLAMAFTVPWCWIYLFGVNKRYTVNPPWIVLEFYFTAGAFIGYALMTFITFVTFHPITGCLGLLATTAYGVGAYFLFLEWRAWRANPVNSAPNVMPK